MTYRILNEMPAVLVQQALGLVSCISAIYVYSCVMSLKAVHHSEDTLLHFFNGSDSIYFVVFAGL